MNVRNGNFDDELYVVEQSDLDFGQDVNRTPKRPKSGLKRTLAEECEDEAAERKAKGVKHGSKVYPSGTFLALGLAYGVPITSSLGLQYLHVECQF